MRKSAYCCDKLLPSFPLAKYVEYIYILKGNCSPECRIIEPWFPGGTMDVVFDLGAPFEQGFSTGEMQTRPQAFVAGLFESGLRIRPTGPVHQLGIVFKPGRFRYFIDGPQEQYKGEIVPLADIFGPAANILLDRIKNTDHDETRIRYIQDFLTSQFSARVAHNPFIDYCVDRMQVEAGQVSLSEMAGRARISNRHFRRLFKDYVGINPKLYCVLLRLERVVKQSLSTSTELNKIAYDLGYYDPSHLSREFKSISGMRAIDFIRQGDLMAKTVTAS